MKYLFASLGMILLFTACQSKQSDDFVLLSVDGKEYKFVITYGEMVYQDPLCNLAFFSEKDADKRELEIYMSLSLHGDGEYRSVDIAEDPDDLTEWAENEKILIFVMRVDSEDPGINGSYYVVDDYFHVKKSSGSYQVTTPEPISLIDELNRNRQVTMELKITGLDRIINLSE